MNVIPLSSGDLAIAGSLVLLLGICSQLASHDMLQNLEESKVEIKADGDSPVSTRKATYSSSR